MDIMDINMAILGILHWLRWPLPPRDDHPNMGPALDTQGSRSQQRSWRRNETVITPAFWIVWVKQRHLHHPPVTIFMGGINHSQMGRLLLFYPH